MKFKNGMSAKDHEKVISTEGIKTYKFGAGESVRSVRKVGFHAIIPGELPFLLSLKTMRERGFIIDCDQDTVSIRMKSGLVVVPVRVGDNGHHYWLTLEHEGRGRNESCLVVHDWNENKNWKTFLKKLHENFRHPNNWRFKELLVGGGNWHEDMEEILEQISKDCQADVCVLPRKRPSKPVLALPRATRFNEVVTLDLVISMKDKPRLFMIDG